MPYFTPFKLRISRALQAQNHGADHYKPTSHFQSGPTAVTDKAAVVIVTVYLIYYGQDVGQFTSVNPKLCNSLFRSFDIHSVRDKKTHEQSTLAFVPCPW
jgi:hypothetical protein